MGHGMTALFVNAPPILFNVISSVHSSMSNRGAIHFPTHYYLLLLHSLVRFFFPTILIHETSHSPGTAVYVVCALALTATSPSGNSDMSFFLDGDLVDTFSKPAPGTSGYDYNVTVYSNTSIPPGFHTLRIQNGHINGPKSIILLDRIIYMYVSIIWRNCDRLMF